MTAHPLSPAPWRPDSPTTVLKGVGPRVEQTLAAAGVESIQDLVRLFPRRYREVTVLDTPASTAIGRLVRIRGRVVRSRLHRLPGRRSMVRVDLTAGDGSPFFVAFFNQPYLHKAYRAGDRRVAQGTLARQGRSFCLNRARLLDDDPAGDTQVQLRYPELSGISEHRLRGLIRQALERIDPRSWPGRALPAGLVSAAVDELSALRAMHAPASVVQHEEARQFFAIREAVDLFRRIERARRRRAARRGPRVEIGAQLDDRVARRIPFAWTEGQAEAVRQIRERLMGAAPMGVLLQGDVGSGKTAVAIYAALVMLANRYQVAFLAPTELLAEQHCDAMRSWLRGSRVSMSLLTAGLPGRERRTVEAELAGGEPRLVFGTHAMLSERTAFGRLGLVVIDEQHRFGVNQRMRLVAKGSDPHVLVMTATPIPRTLALTMFGHLDLVTLRGLPPGRRPARTLLLEPGRWKRCVRLIADRASRGDLVYVVCPRIGEQGEKGGAIRMRAELSRHVECGLVHGRLPAAKRREVIARFRAGRPPVLVGTTVLEVGVDVPDATLMVIAGADRFGLSTLHQLRGRVGRGRRQGLCVLIGGANARMDAICRTSDGFSLAEEDLRLRGSGELLGTRQSGFGDLRALDPIADLQLLLRARAAVREEP